MSRISITVPNYVKIAVAFVLAACLLQVAYAGPPRGPRRPPRPGSAPGLTDDDPDLSPPKDFKGTAMMLYRGGLSLIQSMFLTESEEEDEEIFKLKEKEIEVLHGKPNRSQKNVRQGRRRVRPDGKPAESRQDLDDFHLQVGHGRPHGGPGHGHGGHPLHFTHLQPKDAEVEHASLPQLQYIHGAMSAQPTYHINIDKMAFYNWWELLLSVLRRLFCLVARHHVACTRQKEALTFDSDPFFHDTKRAMSPVSPVPAPKVQRR